MQTKQRVSAKLKKIWSQFKKSVDYSNKSGGIFGRITLSFYTICQSIFGKSPAITVGNSVDSSYTGNETSLISDEWTSSKTKSGDQDETNQTLWQFLRILGRKKLVRVQYHGKCQVTVGKLDHILNIVVLKYLQHSFAWIY